MTDPSLIIILFITNDSICTLISIVLQKSDNFIDTSLYFCYFANFTQYVSRLLVVLYNDSV